MERSGKNSCTGELDTTPSLHLGKGKIMWVSIH